MKWNDPSESDDGAGSETTADVPMEPLLTTIDIWNDDTDPVGDAVLELQLNVTDLDPDGAIGAVENVVNELDTMDMYDFVEWSLSKWWIVYAAVFSMGFITASSLLAVVVYTMKCHKAKLQYRRARVIEVRTESTDNQHVLLLCTHSAIMYPQRHYVFYKFDIIYCSDCGQCVFCLIICELNYVANLCAVVRSTELEFLFDPKLDEQLAAQRKQTNDNMKPLESYCMEITDSEQVILVPGGVGFFGGHIAEHLLKRGHRVVVYDIFNSETTPSAEKRETADVLIKTATEHKDKGSTLKIVNGDICDAVKLESVVKSEGITACFNMAALVNDRRSVTHPTDFIDVNIKGTVNLLRILGEHGVKTVVHASTRSVFGQVVNNNTEWDENAPRLPINPYGATKVATDAFLHVYAHLYGMNVSIIRSSAAYGPRGRLDMFPRICVHRIQNGITINKFGDGSATRTWIYIDDVVSAFLMAFQAMECGKLKGFNEFNIGTEALTTLNEMIETAERVVGKQAVIKQQDVPKGDTHMVGQPKWDKIRTCLGWTPKMSLEDGLRMSLEYSKQKEKRKSNSECINCEL